MAEHQVKWWKLKKRSGGEVLDDQEVFSDNWDGGSLVSHQERGQGTRRIGVGRGEFRIVYRKTGMLGRNGTLKRGARRAGSDKNERLSVENYKETRDTVA